MAGGGGAAFFAGVVATTGSCDGSSSDGIADVIVVADVGAIGGADGVATGEVAAGDAGGCGVERTAMVTPKRIIPATATTHVITARTFLRRGTTTVGRSCEFVSARFSRLDAGASRPE